MQEMKINEKETKEFFIQAFKTDKIVPILGSGFSCGMPARKRNSVPSGTKLKEYMIKMICEERSQFDDKKLKEQSFSWISERFFKCNRDRILEYFYENFTGIKFIGINKKKFLNEISWPYVYTLNIDTAIESSDNDWEVFYPNSEFINKSVFDKKKLYKIHGDVNHFCKSKNVDDLIFSETQYLKSLETNSTFHDMLSADCIGRNLLYIGCSLDDEIDIKYSVITDRIRNSNPILARRIYVTTEDIESDPIKIENLESFQITHFIKLENINDYENFYEFIITCYEESLKEAKNPNDNYEVKNIRMLTDDRDLNLQYLFDSIQENKFLKPYYFIEKSAFDFAQLDSQNINVFIGRRFSGKTLFAYSILEKFEDRKKYYVSSEETIADENLKALLNEHNILAVFDTHSITEEQLALICTEYRKQKNKKNIICIFMNSFDDLVNVISYSEQLKIMDLKFNGYLTDEEIKEISGKLNNMGILAFNKQLTILDNTLRIVNKLSRNYLEKYKIEDKKELILLIWLAVNKKAYLEELISLGIYQSYSKIVEKFSPILEVERNHIGESFEHSSIKIICNAPIALLQIINNYTYPMRTPTGQVIRKKHFDNICSAIYHILISYEKTNADKVKKFLMFDTLNDIFSRQYSKENIEKLLQDSFYGKKIYGAAALIQAIYENEDIQKLKSSEPNYWLQRAKSLYILNSGKKGKVERLREGIEWAKVAEGDSETLIDNGQYKYCRTLSNAIVQAAMFYGKLAYKLFYKDKEINTQAIHYYYKGLSDGNNLMATKSLIARSRGTRDFISLLNCVKIDATCIDSDVVDEAEYLCNIPEYSNGIVYHLNA